MKCDNVVLIEVSGGIADITHAHDSVSVFVIDWDVLADGNDTCPYCYEETEDLNNMKYCPHCDFPVDGSNTLEFLIFHQKQRDNSIRHNHLEVSDDAPL